MSVVVAVGADLFACLFDPEASRYFAKSVGKVSAVDGLTVTCSGLVFQLQVDRHIFVTRSDAESAADQLNVPDAVRRTWELAEGIAEARRSIAQAERLVQKSRNLTGLLRERGMSRSLSQRWDHARHEAARRAKLP
jgi:hypothetical protein